MLFNTIDFALFLPAVFIVYWLIGSKNRAFQNLLLLAASYFFYACWDYRFLFLLIFSTLLDYISGLKIHGADTRKGKFFWLWLSIGINLSFLGVFKYYNFFAASFGSALTLLGLKTDFAVLNIILPVGISFYTFHGLSYIIDIYKDRVKPVSNIVDYSLFVSFFPLLVAGPIERATHLLPQIQAIRTFDYARAADGLRQILWGLCKKIVIADNCAFFVNQIFQNSSSHSGSTLAMGAFLFSIQIYADFSGYSDIALGTARLFGIELLRNFAFPYFSRDIAEFWRRWHISLSSWFRDYVYIPLGGSLTGTWKKIRNTFLIFLASGLWHGANWTFVIWGTLNACFFLPLLLIKRNRVNLEVVAKDKIFPSVSELVGIATTFAFTTFAWIFFRANTVQHALEYVSGIFSASIFSAPQIFPKKIILLTLGFFALEWHGRTNAYAIAALGLNWPRPVRWAMYYAIILCIFYCGGQEQQFIYFQF